MKVTLESRAGWIIACIVVAAVGVGLVQAWNGPRVILLVPIALAFVVALVLGLRNAPHNVELTADELIERRGRQTNRIALSEIRGAEVVPISKAYPTVWVLGPHARIGPIPLNGDGRLLVQALAREIHARGRAYLLKGDLVRATFDPRRDPDQMPEGWIRW